MQVIPNISGGLGNRLFQQAAAEGLAESLGKQTVFADTNFQSNDHDDPNHIRSLFPKVPRVEKPPGDSVITYKEPPMRHMEQIPFPEDLKKAFSIVLHGYQQSENQFPKGGIHPNFEAALSPEICQTLQERQGLETEARRKQTAFVHVRLGDQKILKHHQVNLSSQYFKCLRLLKEKGDVKHILFFSDEPHLVQANFESALHTMGFELTLCREDQDLAALQVMSLCHGGAITANSSFSWWGAYLAKQDAPQPYFATYPDNYGQGFPPPRDIVPEWGLRIPTAA